METLRAIIGEVDDIGEGKFNVAFMPDLSTWITIDSKKFGIPNIGDIVEVIPPQVKQLIAVKTVKI